MALNQAFSRFGSLASDLRGRSGSLTEPVCDGCSLPRSTDHETSLFLAGRFVWASLGQAGMRWTPLQRMFGRSVAQNEIDELLHSEVRHLARYWTDRAYRTLHRLSAPPQLAAANRFRETGNEPTPKEGEVVQPSLAP